MTLDLHKKLLDAVEAHKDGKLQEAEKLYKEILLLQPDHSDANHNLGVIFQNKGNDRDATKYFQIAVNNNPNYEQYWISFLNSLIKSGEVYLARQYAYQVMRSDFSSDKLNSLKEKLNPKRKLEFFYKYLGYLGIFNFNEGELVNGENKIIPRLTNSFLSWFETQKWHSLKLLELGSGGSTIYFSKFFNKVLSFETDTNWYNKVKTSLPKNAELVKVSSMFKELEDLDLSKYDVILIDCGENRAKISRLILSRNFQGIIFFDNSEWYRKSISILQENDYLEIPFFGLKPIEDWVSCTSVLGKKDNLKSILNPNWQIKPKYTTNPLYDVWDNENSTL